jgi:hypothetical protein
MKRLAYLLILLLIAGQADVAWAVSPLAPSAPQADDDDEYLPAQRNPQGERPSSRWEPGSAAAKLSTAEFASAPSGVPSGRTLATPFAPSPLYVFMSLQI